VTTQGFDKRIVLVIKQVYNILENLSKEDRNKVRNKIQVLFNEKTTYQNIKDQLLMD
jgi:hypothetical protein